MSTEDGILWLWQDEWNFDEKPPDIDFPVYFKSLLVCANGDGQLTQAERNWVVGYCAALGGPDACVEELKSYLANENVSTVISQSEQVSGNARAALIFDMIRACSADGALTEGERETIRKMATGLGVPVDVATRLEDLYLEGRRVRDQQLEVMYPAGTPFRAGPLLKAARSDPRGRSL